MNVVALGGSLRKGSYSAAALRAGLAMARQAGATTSLLDLGAVELPLYRPDMPIDALVGGSRAAVEKLIENFRSADVMLWASPTYHGAVTGAFKNAIDYMQYLAADPSPYLQGKAVGLLSIADSAPLSQMAACVHELRAWLAPTRLTLEAKDFSPSLELIDAKALRRLTRLIEELLGFKSPG